MSAETIATDYNFDLAENGITEESGVCQFTCPSDMISDQIQVVTCSGNCDDFDTEPYQPQDPFQQSSGMGRLYKLTH